MERYIINEHARALEAVTKSVNDLTKTTARLHLEVALDKICERRQMLEKHISRSYDTAQTCSNNGYFRIIKQRDKLLWKFYECERCANIIWEIIEEIGK